MIYRFLLLAALSAVMSVSTAALAADEKEDAAPAPLEQQEQPAPPADQPGAEAVPPGSKLPVDIYTEQEKTPEAIAHRKASEKVYNMMNEITEGLGEEEKKHFFMASNNHNLIGTVRMVQGDVGNAIKKCGENNPDMKDKLAARYAEWNDAVNPVLKEADDTLGNMIVAQSYAKPKDLKELFEAMDDTREKAQSRIEKIPVTTPEACQYLLEKLNETQESMLTILHATLVNPAQIPVNESSEPAAGEEAGSEKPPAAEPEKKGEDAKPADAKQGEL